MASERCPTCNRSLYQLRNYASKFYGELCKETNGADCWRARALAAEQERDAEVAARKAREESDALCREMGWGTVNQADHDAVLARAIAAEQERDEARERLTLYKGDEMGSLRDALEAAEQERDALREREKRLRSILEACRPHVLMSKSTTSGRQFQEMAQRLIDSIDVAFAPPAPKKETP